MVDLVKVVAGIQRSGFILEHRVTEALRAHRWVVINNKYYVDDVQESAREIDVVAYKVDRAPEFLIYTALVVSCKKNEENAWALLLRDREPSNPNVDWHPVKVWANQAVMKHILSTEWREQYMGTVKLAGLYEGIYEPSGHLFAFQEVHRERGTVQNDKNIFNAVSSLMKAEAYELGSLERRKKEPAIYTFNLLSITDTELLELRFRGNKIDATEVAESRCVVNYIINRAETSSRVHFVTFPGLEPTLLAYDALHSANVAFFGDVYDSFYKNVFADYEGYCLLRKQFMTRIGWYINHEFEKQFESPGHYADTEIEFYPNADGVLEVQIAADQADLSFLQAHEGIKRRIAEALKKVYRYEGPFRFALAEVQF